MEQSKEFNQTLLSKYADAVARPLSSTDIVKWPVRAGKILKPVRGLFALSFFENIKQQQSKEPDKNWFSYFSNPSQLLRMSHHIIFGLEEIEMDKKVISQNLLLLLKGAISFFQTNEIPDSKNFLLKNSQQIETMLVEFWITNSIILNLSAALWSLAEANYFVAREISCEYHGPYNLSNGDIAIVRDYINLNGVDLHNYQYSFNANKITIVTIHDQSLDIEIDFYNNLLINKGNVKKSFIKGFVIIDNKFIDTNIISDLLNSVMNDIHNLTVKISNLDKEEIIRSYVNLFWYRKSKLSLVSNNTWKPSEDIIQRSYNEVNKKETSSTGGKRQESADIKKSMDYSYWL